MSISRPGAAAPAWREAVGREEEAGACNENAAAAGGGTGTLGRAGAEISAGGAGGREVGAAAAVVVVEGVPAVLRPLGPMTSTSGSSSSSLHRGEGKC